ncbi:heavy metal translocating P-type ATPase [Blattabacterium cuenoti]|uniref:heavy metal translocating P-type ATPase n=1 Tax=Blattabacterium cuenoti TaxID=1653831 RepID=UPI00163C749F|nr:HAD-IC family P-type ATPase [Blattabacterium cuenoti]
MEKIENFDFLNDEKIAEKIIDFKDEKTTFVRFLLPSIHCSGCISVLENLSNIHKDILESSIDFPNKKIKIVFNHLSLKLSNVASILEKIGYKPSINFDLLEKKENRTRTFNKKLIGKLAISFFCFGNIMLLALPEYIGAYEEDIWFLEHRNFFRFLMLILSIPIILLSFIDYIKPAILGLKKHVFNIDIPISIGIFVLFFWSLYEVLLDYSSGYFDSLSGFYFFLLISKIFQIHTHSKILSFNNDYKSFYPIYVSKIGNNRKEKKILLSSLKIGDIIIIRNEEIIPVDSILTKGLALLDCSFITGESVLVKKKKGERVYSGSKHKGEIIYLRVVKNLDNSYLSFLWKNKKCIDKKSFHLNSLSTKFSKGFTPIILTISIVTGIYWSFVNLSKVFQTTFSVLIVTCPCALVLSSPFIFGNIIRFFSRKGFYVKDASTIEKMSTISTIIFDKTGTITDPEKEKIFFIGKRLRHKEKKITASLLRNSNHPLSKKLFTELSIKNFYSVNNFKEILGNGMQGIIENVFVKIGSMKYLGVSSINKLKETTVGLLFNDQFIGYFKFRNFYRKKVEKMFLNIKKYKIIILSGDSNESERKYLKSILPESSVIFFNQSPEEKFNYIKKIQKSGEKVMMIGDGINDCLALNQSEIGVATSDNPTSFFPSCDAFIQSDFLDKIFLFLKISKISTKLVITNFIISLIYNFIGIIYSSTGHLKPFIAAILMPLSSLSVILFSIFSTWIVSRRFLS